MESRTSTILFGVFLCATYFLCCLPCSEARLFTFASGSSPNQPCILLDANFTAELNAFQDGAQIASAQITSDDDNITLTGICGGAVVDIILGFPNGTTFAFVFSEDGDDSSLNQIVQFVPANVFGGRPDLQQYVSFYAPENPIDLGKIGTSYRCHSVPVSDYVNATDIPAPYDIRVKVTFDGIQVQGFDVNNGTFGEPTECDSPTPEPTSNATVTTQEPTSNATVTTQETPSTRGPTTQSPTTLPPGPPVNNYTVSEGNVTCIVFQGAISFEIEYDADTGRGNETERLKAEIKVPEDVTTSGSCGLTSSSQDLSIAFYREWNLTFTFSDKSSDESEADSTSVYRISNITLSYVVDPSKFPNASRPGEKVLVVPDSDEPSFPQKSDEEAGYYLCKSAVDLTLTNDVKVKTSNLKFKAFNPDPDTTFSGDADTCSADNDDDDSSDLVPIIVGVVLAVVVIGVVIIFFVVRSQKQRSEYNEI